MSVETIKVKEIPLDKIPFQANFSIGAEGLGSFTHGFFKYPCKFIPHIPRWAIKKYSTKDRGCVLDPFCGSGTTLVEAVLLDKVALGIDFDPFSRLLAKVKSTPLSHEQLERLVTIIPRLVERAKNLIEVKIPDIPNANLWFTKNTLTELVKIKTGIDELSRKGEDNHVIDFLLVCLASIVRKVSNADNQSPKPYVSRKIKKTPVPVYPTYEQVAFKNIKNIQEFSGKVRNGRSYIIGNDAREIDSRKIEEITHDGIDLAITSPPYINAFDVVRSLKLENFILNLVEKDELPEYMHRQIGTEFFRNSEYKEKPQLTQNAVLDRIIDRIYKIDKRRAYVVYKFFEDIKLNLQSIYDNLKNNGAYCMVVGDSKIRKLLVPTHTLVIDMGSDVGFRLENLFSYDIINRYLRFPRMGHGGLIKRDWVVVLRK
jgi:hypothetical protein